LCKVNSDTAGNGTNENVCYKITIIDVDRVSIGTRYYLDKKCPDVASVFLLHWVRSWLMLLLELIQAPNTDLCVVLSAAQGVGVSMAAKLSDYDKHVAYRQ
jgi:hypothetical protein